MEFGYAIATGKTLFIVGPSENVFHTLSFIRFFNEWGPDIIEALDAFAYHRRTIKGGTVA